MHNTSIAPPRNPDDIDKVVPENPFGKLDADALYGRQPSVPLFSILDHFRLPAGVTSGIIYAPPNNPDSAMFEEEEEEDRLISDDMENHPGQWLLKHQKHSLLPVTLAFIRTIKNNERFHRSLLRLATLKSIIEPEPAYGPEPEEETKELDPYRRVREYFTPQKLAELFPEQSESVLLRIAKRIGSSEPAYGPEPKEEPKELVIT